jgi:hypothetical protein
MLVGLTFGEPRRGVIWLRELPDQGCVCVCVCGGGGGDKVGACASARAFTRMRMGMCVSEGGRDIAWVGRWGFTGEGTHGVESIKGEEAWLATTDGGWETQREANEGFRYVSGSVVDEERRK